MKKLLVLMLALLLSGAVFGQQDKAVKKEVKNSFSFYAGPAIPVGDFQSTTLVSSSGVFSDRETGFAKTGFTIGVNYQYQIVKNIGVGVNLFYNNHPLNNKAFVEQLNDIGDGVYDYNGVKLDHWQWYGISAGPVFNEAVTDKVTLGANINFAMVNANSPRVAYQNETIVGEDWCFAPAVQGGIDVRVLVDKKTFILFKTDYLYMRPKFTMEFNDGTTTYSSTSRQKMSAINISAGIGFNF